ncbi:MAG: discoidin domain-containing protein, partial [Planctomycetes bacterium]|nr:discoidin domain-containing protein [Planctomycetota bacterium]
MCKRLSLVICLLGVVGAGIVPVQAGLQDGLVAYFKFDDGQGTVAADASGNVNNGTLIGTRLTWAPGRDAGALAIAAPATGDVADRLEFPTKGMSAAAGSISVWGYMTDPQPASSGRYLFGHTTQPQWNNRIQVYMQDGTNVSRRLDIGMGGSHTAGADVTELPLQEWFQVALTWNNGAFAAYVNGAQVGGGSYSGLTAIHTIANFGNDASNAPYEAFCGMLDEARVYSRALTAAEVKQIFQMQPVGKFMAKDPNPADKATDVPADTALAWTASAFAATHDVYLGKTFADGNDASRANPKSVLVSQGQNATTYDPAGLLEYGQTYYWRIDEVNAAPDNTIFKGNVWSFTVEPYGYPVKPVAATASSAAASMGPEKTIDGSGLTGDLHGTEPTTMWMSGGVKPNWIQYEFDQVYKLHQLRVWNSNQMIESFLGFGAKTVTIAVSTDGTTWTPVSNVPEFAKASGAAGDAANTTVNLGGVAAKYVKLTIEASWGGLPQTGLSEVRFFYVPVQARAPQPADHATGVALDATLSWRAGREAVSHQVYFGTDANAVARGTAPAVSVTEHTYSPSSLQFGTTYYWKVDEVGAADTQAGKVWSFTTLAYATVDDMESYTDDEGGRIYEAWIDGWTNNTGAVVGYLQAPFAERSIIHGGKQSMPLEYNNVKTPYYSETERTFAPVQNWTGNGANTLVVYFRGRAAGFLDKGAGAFTLGAGGTDIWNTVDQFRFAAKKLTGNGAIVAKVESLVNTDPWAKVGVMIRESMAPGSRFAAVYATPGNGVRYQARLTTDAAAVSDTAVATPAQIALKAPVWVKMERTGNNFSGSYSTDGVKWTAMSWNPQAINMAASPVYIGLCATSH